VCSESAFTCRIQSIVESTVSSSSSSSSSSGGGGGGGGGGGTSSNAGDKSMDLVA